MTTHYTERKIFTSSYYVHIGGSRSRSIDGESVEFHVDPVSSKLVKDKFSSFEEKAPEFVTKPKRQFVNEGETAKFKASFEGSAQTDLWWSFNGKAITADDRHKISMEKEYHVLEIKNVTAADQGTYTCTIKNSSGSDSAAAELEIFVRPKPHSDKSVFLPPTVDVPLEDTEFADKEKDATLVCKFHNGFDATAKWYKDGREVGTWQGKQSFDGRTARLVFRDASKRICGVYQCIVKNTGGEAKTKALVSLLDPKIKPEAPKFTVSLMDQNLESGEKLVLETEVKGLPRPLLKWYKDNTELGSSQDIRMEYKDGKGRLIVDNMSEDEASKFTCVAQNVAGEAQTAAAVTVTGSEDLREPPIFTKELHDMEVDDGDRVEMSVEVKGTPPIDIVWVHNNREIPPTDPVCRMKADGNKRMLIIPEVFPEDQGEYVCEAYNDFGDTDTFCRLVVKEKDDVQEDSDDNVQTLPEFIIPPSPVYVAKGDNAVLKCQVSGQPPPSVIWSKNSETIKHGSKYKLSSVGEEHCLEINSVTQADVAKYTCTLHNIRGQTSASARIHTRGITLDESDGPSINSISVSSERSDIVQTKDLGKASSLSFDINQNVKHSKSNNSPKANSAPLVERKGGVHQFDFRSVLKHTSQPNKTLTDRDLIKLPADKDSKPERDFRNILKHKKFSVESRLDDKVNKLIKGIDHNKSTDFKNPGLDISKGEHVTRQNTVPVHSAITSNNNTRPKRHSDFKNCELDKHKSEHVTRQSTLPTRSAVDHNIRTNPQHGVRSVISHRQLTLDKQGESKLSGTTRENSDIHKIELKKANTIQLDDRLFTNRNTPNSINGQPVSQVLQKFESNHASAKVDFRNVLKHQKEHVTDKKDYKLTKMEQLGKVIEENRVNETDISEPSKSDIFKTETELIITDETIRAKIEEELKNPPTVIKEPKHRMRTLKPSFKNHLMDQTVPYGSEVVLECHVAGKPEPDIKWSINNKEIKKSKFFQMSYNNPIARLVIAETFSEDEGEYRCTATNSQGSETSSCDLYVQKCPSPVNVSDSDETETDEDEEEVFSPTVSPPKIYDISPAKFCITRGQPIEFRASFSAVPQGTVKWLLNKQEIFTDGRIKIDTSEHFSTLSIGAIEPGDSGKIDVIVENDIGIDTAVASLTVQDVPDPPVGHPSVSDVTLHSVTLSWYGPAYDGGCPITNYRVEMSDAEDQEWKLVTKSCKNTTYFIDKLTPHTPYFFRVFAENKVGLSQSSQTEDVTVTTEPKPSALNRTLSFDSDDVFSPEASRGFSPVCEFASVSPLSPDEIPFEHREVKVTAGRKFEDLYECQHEVGKGKFGSVYKCVEKGTGKHWAAKILKCREADKGKVKLEIDVMNQLKHPKILMLWDAFEAPRKMILVMEYVGGGELFERVLDDGFDLTERDVIQFMRQICDAVAYMHEKNIIHLDLKPENILCVKNESNKIKIIDFGLARFYRPGESTRVLFGTPEFIAPEVVNYEEIGFKTDMWSIGVICYVLLSGLSPFMGDSDAETLSNVTQGEFDFDDDSFEAISEDAKDFIDNLLLKDKRKRITAKECKEHHWLTSDAARMKTRRINTANLKRFMARRKWQKTGNAIRALGRITSLQRLFKKDPSNISSCDSGNGSVSSSTSSVSSSDSQSNLIQDHDNNTLSVPRLLPPVQRKTEAHISRASDTEDTDIKSNPGISKQAHISRASDTEETDIKRNPGISNQAHISRVSDKEETDIKRNPGISNHLNNGPISQESNDSANDENRRTCVSSIWKTKLKPPAIVVEKPAPSIVNNSKPINQLIGKFETTKPKTEKLSDNRTVLKTATSSQIKVRLKQPNDNLTTEKTAPFGEKTASSCENCDKNQNTQKSHINDDYTRELPHFVKEMVDSKAFPGDSVRFDVEFKGRPEAEVTWYFEEDTVLESPRHVIQCLDSGTCSLIIKDVSEDDDGEYFCKIVNSLGEDTCSAELIVYGAI